MEDLSKKGPFTIKLSFKKLIQQYRDRLEHESNPIVSSHIENILSYLKQYPDLEEGIQDFNKIAELQEPIALLLGDLFPKALTMNEIKVAAVPFQDILFNHSQRFKNILDVAGPDFSPSIIGMNEDHMYMMACSFILAKHYQKGIDLKRPFYFEIPDQSGMIRSYKLAINVDYTDIYPSKNAKEITESDIQELLQNYDDPKIWKEKFPPHSWVLEGFNILNLIDVTVDTVISDIKSNLLDHTPNTNNNFDEFEANFKKLYNNIDLNVGFTLFDAKSGTLLTRPEKETDSFLLNDKMQAVCENQLCACSYQKIIKQQELFSIANVNDYAEKTEHNSLSKTLLANGIQSCIFAPIVFQGELLGILELVSKNPHELNSINANKLEDILPYIVTTAKRSLDLAENQIKAVIQSECTSIHPTVLWKFEEEAQKFLVNKLNEEDAYFDDIAFDYVFPLFGQIDIVGSSTARNNAIQEDFLEQLSLVEQIFKKAKAIENLPFYEQMIFRIETFSKNLKNTFNTTSEESLLHFLSREINPIMPHIQNLSEALKKDVLSYEKKVNPQIGIIYNKRKDYEHSVQIINEQMAAVIDKKQEQAQTIFPHFYERFKTDGVEHNMYIGQSLVKDKQFNKVYLHNLRLWQLTTMCEMENDFYSMQKELPMQLNCASLLLVFSNSLSIRYRIDEKRFDVDGSYNARYEIIKKRIDKAHIKGTTERITQKGKLVIVYSQKKDELEYLRYLEFLKSKNYIEQDLELVELEDLQGVVGLKAIRANIIYNNNAPKITYNDLIKEIENK